MCGGTDSGFVTISTVSGLSPRVRGNRLHRDEDGDGGGSIPACAGEPRSAVPVIALVGVYPRVCGGTRAAAGEGGR